MSAFNSPAHALSWLRKQGWVVGQRAEVMERGKPLAWAIDIDLGDHRERMTRHLWDLKDDAGMTLLRGGWVVRNAADLYVLGGGGRAVWTVDRLGCPTIREDR